MPAWMISPFRNYAAIKGRATRREFFAFALFFIVATVGAHYFDARNGPAEVVASYMGMAELVMFVLLILPFIAVSARRLHDCGRSAWWLLFLYLPYLGFRAAIGNEQATIAAAGVFIAGATMLLIQLALPGHKGENQFGADPRASSNAA